MVVSMFFIQSPELCDKEECEEFAGAMLHCNCFLFNHNDRDDYRVCCIILSLSDLMFCRNGQGFGKTQTFALHFNFVASSVLIPVVDRKSITARVGLALSVTTIS